jgi:integrase/recombinase XerD
MSTENQHPTSRAMTSLLQRMAENMRSRNLAPATQRSYLHYVAEFIRHHDCDPEQLGLEAVRRYQLHLLQDRKLSAESVNTFTSAVRFLYLEILGMPWQKKDFVRTRVERKAAPAVLSPDEIRRFFHHIPGIKNRAAMMLCYGAGLSAKEAVAVKVANIDGLRRLLLVENGNHAKDRHALLSADLLDVLRTYWRLVRPSGPWLFPSCRAENHISSGVLARACLEAWQLAGQPDRISPRTIRYSFAGCLLDREKVNRQVIQAILGHSGVDVAKRYTPAARTRSGAAAGPLDQLLLASPKRAGQIELVPFTPPQPQVLFALPPRDRRT